MVIQQHSLLETMWLSFCIFFIVAVLYFVLIYIPRQISEKTKYTKYPRLKEFENYAADLVLRIQTESSYHFVKKFVSEIDSIHAKYHNEVPDVILKATVLSIRNKYYERRKELAPKFSIT